MYEGLAQEDEDEARVRDLHGEQAHARDDGRVVPRRRRRDGGHHLRAAGRPLLTRPAARRITSGFGPRAAPRRGRG